VAILTFFRFPQGLTSNPNLENLLLARRTNGPEKTTWVKLRKTETKLAAGKRQFEVERAYRFSYDGVKKLLGESTLSNLLRAFFLFQKGHRLDNRPCF